MEAWSAWRAWLVGGREAAGESARQTMTSGGTAASVRLSLSDARLRLAPGKAGRRPATPLHVLHVSM
jgi:hypothetical protein